MKPDRRPLVYWGHDRPGWAFAHIDQQVSRRLADEFDAVAHPFPLLSVPAMRTPHADVGVVFWWASWPLFRQAFPRAPLVLCVYDGYSTQEPADRERFREAARHAAVVACANRALSDQVADLHARPVFVVEDGVDVDLFTPAPMPATFTACWCGNSSGAASAGGPADLKGVALIREACEREGILLRLLDLAAIGKPIPHESMPAWYHAAAVYVCASEREGTPNPVLEALACGRPVVSTRVGLVPHVALGDAGRQAVRLVDRTADDIARALRELRAAHDLGLLAPAGRWAREAVLPWSWSVKAEAWRACLTAALEVAV